MACPGAECPGLLVTAPSGNSHWHPAATRVQGVFKVPMHTPGQTTEPYRKGSSVQKLFLRYLHTLKVALVGWPTQIPLAPQFVVLPCVNPSHTLFGSHR